MMRFRLVLSLVLSVVLAVTSVTAAVARGHAAAGTYPGGSDLVICSGDGTVTVTLDANGNPTSLPAGLPRHCPDCVAALGPAVLPELALPARPLPRFVQSVAVPEGIRATRLARLPQARGPPACA